MLHRQVRAESGIPATVLRAYRAAESSVARTDPGCRLPWELPAAIGKVESGQARGGAVDGNGTTLGRITGPPLDGRGFALIRDTDGGAHDGDTVYDRAVGPMQFLPSTWARWGTDGNGDGRADPNNIFDAALAAGHYLCAGERDLRRPADLDRAVLSYNHSRSYLRLVRYWLAFYSRGVHAVPDGEGVVPRSPGAGGDTPATEPVDGGSGGRGGGVVIGPQPSPTGGTGPSPRPSPSVPGSPEPTSPSPGPSTSDLLQVAHGAADRGSGDRGLLARRRHRGGGVLVGAGLLEEVGQFLGRVPGRHGGLDGLRVDGSGPVPAGTHFGERVRCVGVVPERVVAFIIHVRIDSSGRREHATAFACSAVGAELTCLPSYSD